MRKKCLIVLACLSLFGCAKGNAPQLYGDQAPIPGGAGVYWSDVRTVLDANFAEVLALQSLTGILPGVTRLGPFSGAIIPTDSTIRDALQSVETAIEAVENALGNPTVDGYFLSSSVAGVRTWVPPPDSMEWPAAVGLAVYGGSSAWGTSITVGSAANNIPQLNGSAQLPAVGGALLTASFTGGTLSAYTTLQTAIQALGTVVDGSAVDLTFGDGFDVAAGAVSFDPVEVLVWDLGASTSFELPNGANPTTDAAGEIAVDSSTGAGQGVRAFGAVGFTLPAYISKCTTISAATSSSDFMLTRFPYAVTVRRITVTQTGATNVIGGVDECTSAGATCGALDSDITATTTMATDDGTLTDSAIAADGVLLWHTTSVSGTNTQVMICVDVTANQVN